MSKKLWSDNKKMKSLMENWRGFVTEEEIPGADVARGVVPVVDFLNSDPGKDPKVRAALEAGKFDGDPDDEVIDVSEPTLEVKNLGPTQNQISLIKSIGWPLSTQDSVKNVSTGDITGRGKRIVTSDNLVIDGHHRWSSTWATAGPNAKINATNIALPGGNPDQKLAVAQISIAATMPNDSGNVPKATAGGDEKGSDNILGKGAKEIKQMILDRVGSQTEGGILLGPEYLAQIVQNPAAQDLWNLKPEMTPDQATEAITNVVATNLSQLPAPQGPTRDYMPQFDGGETHKGEVSLNQVIDKMKSGQVNYDDPSMDDLRRMRKSVKEVKEVNNKKIKCMIKRNK